MRKSKAQQPQQQPLLVFGSLGADEAMNTITDSVELPKTVEAHLKQHTKNSTTTTTTTKTKQQQHTRDTNHRKHQNSTTPASTGNEHKSKTLVPQQQQQQQNQRSNNKPSDTKINTDKRSNKNVENDKSQKKSNDAKPSQQKQQQQQQKSGTQPASAKGANKKNNSKTKSNQQQEDGTTANKQRPDAHTLEIPASSNIPDPSSWAELFGATAPAKNTTTTDATSTTATTNPTSPTDVAAIDAVATSNKKNKKNKKAKKEDAILQTNDIQYDPLNNVYITPRGLKNVRNSCYINAGIQSLLTVPPFYNLFKKLGTMGLNREVYPLTRAMSQFVNEFSTSNSNKPGDRVDIGIPFTPASILDYMRNVNTEILRHGDQHDVHEFLQFLLHELHSELRKTSDTLNANNSNNSTVPAYLLEDGADNDEEDTWQEVGKNNKASTVQEIRHDESPISKLFAGKMRNLVKKRSAIGSLTVQPFYSLHLPIDSPNIHSLKDSLRLMTGKEHLGNASMQFALEDVPDVLLIQLIRFKYEDNRNVKIGKFVEFPDRLYLDKNVIGTAKIKENDPKRFYELQSVICHHGKEASGGHYSTYVHHPNNKWIHLDDQNASVVPLDHVLKQQAYVLIYVRSAKPHTPHTK